MRNGHATGFDDEETLAILQMRKIQDAIIRSKERAFRQYLGQGFFVTSEQAEMLELSKSPAEINGKLFVYKDEIRRKLSRSDRKFISGNLPELAQWLNIPIHGNNQGNLRAIADGLSASSAGFIVALGGDDGRKVSALIHATNSLIKVLSMTIQIAGSFRKERGERPNVIQRVLEENILEMRSIMSERERINANLNKIEEAMFFVDAKNGRMSVTSNNKVIIDRIIDFIKRDENYRYMDGNTIAMFKGLMGSALESQTVTENDMVKWKNELEKLEGGKNDKGRSDASPFSEIIEQMEAKIKKASFNVYNHDMNHIDYAM